MLLRSFSLFSLVYSLSLESYSWSWLFIDLRSSNRLTEPTMTCNGLVICLRILIRKKKTVFSRLLKLIIHDSIENIDFFKCIVWTPLTFSLSVDERIIVIFALASDSYILIGLKLVSDAWGLAQCEIQYFISYWFRNEFSLWFLI